MVIVSPDFNRNGMFSFQSSCACFPACVSKRITGFFALEGRFFLKKEELDFFEHAVNGLDERHRSIITDLLDEDMTWDIMMERYHVSHTMIAKYRKAALKELDKQYELRDRQVEAFVLG